MTVINREWLSGLAMGAVACAIPAIMTMNHLSARIADASDRVTRIELQYRDCRMVGQYPTNADMLRETEESHE